MTSESPPRRGRGRPRREGADEEILSVALELLREKGYRDLTVDAVAEASGVAKTTVYRRWPSKGVLVAAALAPLTPSPGASLDALLEDIRSLLMLIASSAEPEVVDVIRAVIEPRRLALRSHVDDVAADLLIGGMLTRLLITGEPLTADFTREIVKRVIVQTGKP